MCIPSPVWAPFRPFSSSLFLPRSLSGSFLWRKEIGQRGLEKLGAALGFARNLSSLWSPWEQVVPDTECFQGAENCGSAHRQGCPKSSHWHPGMLRCFSSTEILGSVTQTKQGARCSPLWCSSSRSHSEQSTWVGRITILSLLSSLLTVLYGSQWPLHSLPVLNLCGAFS